MGVNIGGAVGIAVFYFIILLFGFYAARKHKRQQSRSVSQDDVSNIHHDVILAGRNLSCVVATFTLTATWVGGCFINGTAERVYSKGVVWAHAPLGYAFSLILGGLLFAKKMRDAGYVTMFDPLQEKYGKVMSGILFIPALLGEFFWSAAILNSLGALFSVVFQLNIDYALVASAVIAIVYTLIGGFYTVVITDILQLFCIVIGLWLTIPFAMIHDHVKDILVTRKDWLGEFNMNYFGEWIDIALVLSLGGIPWQVYFQRVLSAKSSSHARILSISAALGCIVMAIPAVLLGGIASSTDWKSIVNDTNDYLNSDGKIADKRMVLPLVLQYLTPSWLSYIGLGAISAAVMSSFDSLLVSTSSVFSYNIYKMTFRKQASPIELVWVFRISLIFFGAATTVAGFSIKTVYDIWVLSSDLVYVVLFPQLLCAVYMKSVNIYGSIPALIIGLVLRILAGEQLLNIPAVMKYPYYDEQQNKQLFPYRTFAMCSSLLILITVSLVADLYEKRCGRHMSQNEIDILKISYKEPEKSTVTSFSKISRWSGSYNNITASALELRNRSEDRSLLKSTLHKHVSACSNRTSASVHDEKFDI